jgi:hypothetical protein
MNAKPNYLELRITWNIHRGDAEKKLPNVPRFRFEAWNLELKWGVDVGVWSFSVKPPVKAWSSHAKSYQAIQQQDLAWI